MAAAAAAGSSSAPKKDKAALLAALEARVERHASHAVAKKARAAELASKLATAAEEEKEAIRLQHLELEKELSRMARKRYGRADFESLAIIGKGHFGEVHVVRALESAGRDYVGRIFALKIMSKGHVRTVHQMVTAKAERDVLVDNYNQWVVGLHLAFQDAKNLYLVMDFMAGGDLMGLLIAKDTFPEAATRQFAAEMIMAVGSVHAMGYIHRDVKPDNILIDERGHLKLADLGLATKVDDGDSIERAAAEAAEQKAGEQGETPSAATAASSSSSSSASSSSATGAGGHRPKVLRQTVCGTCDYMAPEVLLRKGYDKSVDWWAVGAIVFECLFGYAPFWAESAEGTARKIVHWRHYLRLPAPSSALSAEAIDFMARTLTKSSKRLGAGGLAEVQAHPWFHGLDWDRLAEADGPYLNSKVRAAASALEALHTLPRSDGSFEATVRAACVSFEDAKVVPADKATAELDPAEAASKVGVDRVVGYTYSRDGASPPTAPGERRKTSAAAAMLQRDRKAAKAKAAAGDKA